MNKQLRIGSLKVWPAQTHHQPKRLPMITIPTTPLPEPGGINERIEG